MNKTDPPRVLFVNPPEIWGGAEAALLALMRRLPAHGWRPILITGEQAALATAAHQAGISVVNQPLPSLRNAGAALLYQLPAAVFAVARAAVQQQAVLIHSNALRGHLIAALAGRLVGRPVIWTLNDNVRVPRRLMRALAPLPRAVIAVSPWLREAWSPLGLASKTVVIPPALEIAAPVAVNDLRTEWGVSATAPLALYVGRLVPDKGAHYFVEAARRIAPTLPEARYLLVGGGEPGSAYLTQLQRQIAATELGDRLRLVGHRTDVARFYTAADVVAMCSSRPEGFGLVALEAMRLAKPVVATDVPGVHDLIQPNVTGWLVPPQDEAALAGALLQALTQPARAQAMGATAQAWALQAHAPEIPVRRILDLYAQVLGLIAERLAPAEPVQLAQNIGVARRPENQLAIERFG